MLAQVLAVRLTVLIAVLGGIVLAYTALPQPDTFRLWLLGIYGVGVVWPVILLAGATAFWPRR